MNSTAVRLPRALLEEIDKTCRSRGFTDRSEFIREAIRNELRREDSEARMKRHVDRIGEASRATFALTLAAIKELLSLGVNSKALANERLNRVLATAAADFDSDVRDFFKE